MRRCVNLLHTDLSCNLLQADLYCNLLQADLLVKERNDLATPPTPSPVTRLCCTWPKSGKDIGSNLNFLNKRMLCAKLTLKLNLV